MPKEPKETITLLTADVSQMSKVEKLKSESAGLFWIAGRQRTSFAAELDALTRGESETLGNDAKELSKFFGIYKQQLRIEGRKSGDYVFMVRLRCPAGGEISPEQWLALDAAAERFADGSIRLTTRQAVQFHYVGSKLLGPLIRHLNERYADRGYRMTTLGACGDINRNTMCSPIDDLDPELALRSRDLAHAIAAELSPRAGGAAYYQIFMEAREEARLVPVVEDEPLYGTQYLPRKFKVGIAHPNDGSVDVLTQDVGLVPVCEGAVDAFYDLYTGGGLGTTHNNADTRQLLGLYLGRVPRDEVVRSVAAIAVLQKENGERSNRRQARWKYTIRRLGVESVRQSLRERFGIPLADAVARPLPRNRFFHGWNRQASPSGALFFYGLPVESGRLVDRPPFALRSAVRAIVGELGVGVRITPNQDLLLCHVPAAARARLTHILEQHGVPAEVLAERRVRRQSLACPARPTCGLAMTDAELALPGYMDAIESQGLGDLDLVIRVSGCPNSCSRPPTADIGVIGYGKNDHRLQVGGARDGSRIGRVLYDRVSSSELPDVLAKLAAWLRVQGSERPADELLAAASDQELRSWIGLADDAPHASAAAPSEAADCA